MQHKSRTTSLRLYPTVWSNAKRICVSLILLTFAVLSSISSQPVNAAGYNAEQLYEIQTGTGHYDPDETCTSNSSSTTTSITVNNNAAQKVAQDASKGGVNVGFALYASNGQLAANYNDTFETYGASITKSMLLVAYLNQLGGGVLTNAVSDDLTAMIEQSDDAKSNDVYGLLNNPSQEVNTVAQKAGMSGFKYNDTGDSLYRLGQSQITANDFARFFSIIDTMIPAAQKPFALKLLSNITPNSGLLQANLPGTVYSKEGWKPEPGGGSDPPVSGSANPFGNEGAPWIVNQAGQFQSNGQNYGVAVTVAGTLDESTGETIIQKVVSALVTSGGQSQSSGSGCCSSTSSSTPTATKPGGTGGFALNQVETFASEPVTSTWNISNSTVEQWFLKQAGAQATIAKYGLNSGNIGSITSAVAAANVSPVFFYLYTVNEGGGAGGFINHYPGDTGGGGPGNAKRDALYLASQSQSKSAGVATGGGEPGNMPTADAQKILNAMPLGSICVVYIKATSAVTAELEDLSGKTGSWSGLFNKPLSAAMQNIKTMGGDPSTGGSTVSASGCTGSVTGQGIAKAVAWAVMIANNNGYGYDQPGRATGWTAWKANPSCTHACGSFDCSSFISAALTEAGYFQSNPNFATGNEVTELTSVGFTKIASSTTTSAGLQPGDILVWDGHTEMYIGNDQAVAAHSNELGGVSGGQVGDQTGHEISVEPFGSSLSSDPWIGIYRAP